MKTTIIPAQITTVEDKIVGNLNLTQVTLLILPVVFTTVIYSLLPPSLHLSWYKLPIILTSLLVCLALSIRIKGKVMLNWLIIILRYNLRPKYYVYNKNDSFLKEIQLFPPKISKKRFFKPASNKALNTNTNLSLTKLLTKEKILDKKNYSFIFKQGRKGGLNVSLAKIQE